MYLVLKRIWHRGNKRNYEPGAEVTLWHLNNAEIKKVISLGLVQAIPKVAIKKVVKKKKRRPRKKVEIKKPKVHMIDQSKIEGDNYGD